jgi:hypothetical protein
MTTIGIIYSLDISNDNKYVVGSGSDKNIEVYDL